MSESEEVPWVDRALERLAKVFELLMWAVIGLMVVVAVTLWWDD